MLLSFSLCRCGNQGTETLITCVKSHRTAAKLNEPHVLEVSKSCMAARCASKVKPNTQQVLTVKSVWAVSDKPSRVTVWHKSGDPHRSSGWNCEPVNPCHKLWIKSMASMARDF